MDLSAVPAHFHGRVSESGKYADFSRAGFTRLPDWICTLSGLTTLRLDDNGLASLPDDIDKLVNLTELFLPGNELTRLPTTIGDLTNLSWLRVSGNRLVELPDTIGNLVNLTGLEVGSNQLTRLPTTIGNLTNLSWLRVSGNRLVELPDTIGNLVNLRELDVTDNQLTQLPRGLANLLAHDLQLRLEQNPMADPLPELIQRGQAELAAYLRSLEDAATQYEAKVLLVGEGTVGKSSLVAALKGERFIDGRPTTHGIEISAVPFRHPQLDLDMTLRRVRLF